MYNFALYNAWCDAALKLGLELKSKSGGCIYMHDPVKDVTIGKEYDAEHNFFWMLWTPLNKLSSVFRDLESRDWQMALLTLKDNHSDFHIEAAKYHCNDESHYDWFPEINHKAQANITVDGIIKCVKRIRDFNNHDKHQTAATLRASS